MSCLAIDEHQSASVGRCKPPKPRADFPLTAHANGQWCKKIKGVVRMFGVWDDPTAAEAIYWQEKDDWEAGRNPRLAPERPGTKELYELADRWLLMRRDLLTVKDPFERIAPITYAGGKAAIMKLMSIMGKRVNPLTWTPEDFRRLRIGLGEGVSPATKGQRIMYVRALFDWCLDTRLIPQHPDYGREFENVKAAEKEEYRYDFQKENGERKFELDEVRRILNAVDAAAARVPGDWGNHAETKMLIGARMFRACTYLAANTGCNSKDIARLTFADLSLDKAYVERKRSKTAALWQATLWPETVEAIREYLEVRPAPMRSENDALLFLTASGFPVNHGTAKVADSDRDTRSDALRQACSKLLVKLGLKRPGVTFGAWRHTFRSEAADALHLRNVTDVNKVDAIYRIMASRIPGSANRYVKLRPEQLRPITDAVRAKLLGDAMNPGSSNADDLRLVG